MYHIELKEMNIKKIVELIGKTEGFQPPKPCNNKSITRCNRALERRDKHPLPDDYVEFLNTCNGLLWKGVKLYSTDVLPKMHPCIGHIADGNIYCCVDNDEYSLSLERNGKAVERYARFYDVFVRMLSKNFSANNDSDDMRELAVELARASLDIAEKAAKVVAAMLAYIQDRVDQESHFERRQSYAFGAMAADQSGVGEAAETARKHTAHYAANVESASTITELTNNVREASRWAAEARKTVSRTEQYL